MFSVIIPYYKKRNYIERCIDSVLSQSFKNFEIILVDDGSNDDLYEIVDSKYKDKLKLITQHNMGVSAARNAGIANASLEYIAFLDADDYWSPFYLESLRMTILELNCDIVATGFTHKKENLQIERLPIKKNIVTIDEYLLRSAYSAIIFTSSVVATKELIIRTGVFDTSLNRGEDIDMWFRLIINCNKFVKINNLLSFYDIEVENQATSQKSDFQYSFVRKIEQLSQIDYRHYLFSKRFMYYRLFDLNISHPNKTKFFIEMLNLDRPFFSIYRVKPQFLYGIRNSLSRRLIKKYLKLTISFVK